MNKENVIPFPGQGLRNMYGAPQPLYARERHGEFARAVNLKKELNLPGHPKEYMEPVVWAPGKPIRPDDSSMTARVSFVNRRRPAKLEIRVNGVWLEVLRSGLSDPFLHSDCDQLRACKDGVWYDVAAVEGGVK